MRDLAIRETHASWLLLTPSHVYKVKKPVHFDFMDLTDPATRRRLCEAETELNRRLAPDVYEGVGWFEEPGGRREPVVVMRRLPAERCLAELVGLDDPFVEWHVASVAATLAAFHARARTDDQVRAWGRAEAIARLWEDNLSGLARTSAGIIDPYAVEAAGRLAGDYIAGREPLFASRILDDRVVDGHGDLLCDDVFCLDDGPRILDCLEFSERLRAVDMLLDAASLAADLERLGRPDLAALWLEEHARSTGDDWPASLAHFYVAYRALVRAKVACIRAGAASRVPSGPAVADADEARRLVAMALDHLREGAVRMVLVGGLPGSGKSTLADGLSEATGWPVISTDIVRKRLAGLDPYEPAGAAFGAGIHSPQMTAAVYAEMITEADTLLGRGRSVILDGSWLRRCWRDAALEMAARRRAAVVPILCHVPSSVAADRIRRRAGGATASDATPAIRESMADMLEPWDDAVEFDASQPVEDLVEVALELAELP